MNEISAWKKHSYVIYQWTRFSANVPFLELPLSKLYFSDGKENNYSSQKAK
jgi:hypothetical protein